MRLSLLVPLLWVLGCACAEAQVDVVLFERAGLRSSLCGALRIQLSGAAEVRCVADRAGELLSERLELAARRLREQKAQLGVLLERDPDPGRVRMYILTGRGDQAVLAIERIEDRPDPDVDRSLALKVRNSYEVIAFVTAQLPSQAAPAAASAVLSPAAERRAVARAEGKPLAPLPAAVGTGSGTTPWLLFADLGGGLNAGKTLRGFGQLLLGAAQASARTRYELGLGVRLGSRELVKRGARGSASMLERGPLLSARALWRSGRLELGAAFDFGLSFARAEGTSSDGRVGRRDPLITPVVGIGPDLRVQLFRSAYLRCAPSLEIATIRQLLQVEERILFDGGRARVSIPLSLVIALPLTKTSQEFQP